MVDISILKSHADDHVNYPVKQLSSYTVTQYYSIILVWLHFSIPSGKDFKQVQSVRPRQFDKLSNRVRLYIRIIRLTENCKLENRSMRM